MTTLLDRPVPTVTGQLPVLAIVDLAHPYDDVLARAAAASRALGCPVRLVLLARRTGLSTDAALVARVARRLRSQRDIVLAALHRHAPELADSEADLAWYPRLPYGQPVAQARRAARRAAGRHGARVVILPQHLHEAADQAAARAATMPRDAA